MRHRRHSLSGRLLLLFLLTAFLLAVVVRTGFRYGVDGSLRELAGPHLDAYLQHLLAELGNPPAPGRAAQLAERLPLQIHLLGAERWSSAGAPPVFPPRRSVIRTLPDGTEVELGRGPNGFAARARRSDVTVVLVPHGFEPADSAPLAVALTITSLLALLALAYHAIRRLFRPIETIQAGVARIGAGHLEHRLDIGRRDELGELAQSILHLDPAGTWLPLDPARIRLLARNLLKKAIRHTPPGGRSPSLSSHVDDERWTLSVSDEGPGIAAEHLSHLTEPFYRADPSRQRGSGGVGLGLYLSRAIAEAHGGTLAIESTPGQGTSVRVIIPVPRDR